MENYIFPDNLNADARGYESLFGFRGYCVARPGADIHIDWSNVQFLEASLSAPLAAIFHHLKTENGNRFICDCKPFEEKLSILSRNGFTRYLETTIATKPDNYQTTIPLLFCPTTSSSVFGDYIEQKFLGHGMIKGLLNEQQIKDFQGHFVELFSNALEHARSPWVMVCGQYYKTKNELRFTLTDVGRGFLSVVSEKFPIENTATRAITWAVAGNTTRDTQGGYALQSLSEYCLKHKSCLQIVSDGYLVEFDGKTGRKKSNPLASNSKGVSISILFNCTT